MHHFKSIGMKIRPEKSCLYLLLLLSLDCFGQNPTNQINKYGMRQGTWSFINDKSPIKVVTKIYNDIPNDTLYYYEKDILKFTYIHFKDSSTYTLNNGNSECKGHLTLKTIYWCSTDTIVRKLINKYIFYEVMPKYYGGENAMYDYLYKKMKEVPTKYKGRVKVSFKVDTKGKATEIKIAESENEKLNDYCIKIIQDLPPWQPAFQGGKIVSCPLTLPLNFK